MHRPDARTGRSTHRALGATVATLAVCLLTLTLSTPASARSGPGRFGQAVTWTEQHPPTSPPAVAYAPMVYDGSTGTVLLLDGTDGMTWSWDGTTWTDLGVPAPSVGEPALAYDEARGEVVLFGGETGEGGGTNDTWTFDGTAWTELDPPTRPPARYGASMVFDSARSVIVLFGGLNGVFMNDTWTWDGTTWIEVTPAISPKPRYSEALAYDRGAGQVVLFGGYVRKMASCKPLHDTWTWDGTSWTQQHPAVHPGARNSGGMVYDAAMERTVLFGGVTCRAGRVTYLDNTWTWDGSNWMRMSPSASPSRRTGVPLAYDEARSEVVLFGGYARAYFDDTWTLGATGSTRAEL